MVLKKSQIKFLLYFALIFILSFTLLYLAGLVPSALKADEGETFRTLWDKAQGTAVEKQREQNSLFVPGEEPVRIVIDEIGVDINISNPNTTNVATLDEYLVQGAVRYPGSGLLGQGNMYIFGHSSTLNVVNNQAYKAFNGLKNLTEGDTITVSSATKVYTYRVTSVTLTTAEKALVEFGNNKNMLTLSTCNTFGAKSERYVVEADFISSL